jgi:carboxymethylenebutenolidase
MDLEWPAGRDEERERNHQGPVDRAEEIERWRCLEMLEFVAREVACANGMPGYLAIPETDRKVPAVVILHERYGFGQHQRDVADRFARNGIAGFAINGFFECDFQPELAAGTRRFRFTDAESVEFTKLAIQVLKETGRVDSSKIASLGMCQTGRHPLIMAAESDALAAAICWYGAGSNKEFEVNQYYTKPLADYLANVKCPILGIFGGLDGHIPVSNVRRIRDELEKHQKIFEFYIVENSPHGFLNNCMQTRYRHEQSEYSWKVQLEFLHKAFNQGFPPDQIRQHYLANLPIEKNAPHHPH